MKLLLKPHLAFLFASLLFGLAMIVVTPPFKVPDEVNHFYRAYQISEGQLIPTRTINRLGGDLPRALGSFTQRFQDLIAHPGQSISYEDISNTIHIEIQPSQRQWFDFPNTGIYSFLNYVPQALGICIVRSFTSSVLLLFYGSRVFTCFFWIASLYFAIRQIPLFKWLFVALALLPMSLFINTSLSGDVVNNAVSFFFIAWTLHLSFRKSCISMVDAILLLLFAFGIAALKMVYAPLLLLILLIPSRKFKSKAQRVSILAAVVVFAAGALALSYLNINKLYLPYSEYAPEAGWVHLAEAADKNLQLTYLLNNLDEILPILFRSLVHNFAMYSRGYIGTFGWLSIELPLLLTFAAYAYLIAVACLATTKIKLNLRQKLIMSAAFAGMLCLVVLSQYLNWAIVGSELINTLQGRYFIPVFPLIFLTLSKPFRTSVVPPAFLVLGGSSLLLSYSIMSIYTYYFI